MQARPEGGNAVSSVCLTCKTGVQKEPKRGASDPRGDSTMQARPEEGNAVSSVCLTCKTGVQKSKKSQKDLHCSPCPHARLADSHQEVLAKYTHGMIRSIANKPKKGKIYHGQGSNQVHRSGTAPEAAALDRSATVTHRTLSPCSRPSTRAVARFCC